MYYLGKATFDDVDGKAHELHFCEFFAPIEGNKWGFYTCNSFNETISK